MVIGGFFGLAYLFGERISVLIQSAERGLTFVAVLVAAVLAVIAFFSFRRRRIQILDQDPEALFENREIIFGPAADRIADAVRLGEVEGKAGDRRTASELDGAERRAEIADRKAENRQRQTEGG